MKTRKYYEKEMRKARKENDMGKLYKLSKELMKLECEKQYKNGNSDKK